MSVAVVVTSPYPSDEDIMVEVVEIEAGNTVGESRITEGNYAKFTISDNQSIHITKVPKLKGV